VPSQGESRWWLAYLAFQSAALWTQLYAALLFAALNLWYVGRIAYQVKSVGGTGRAFSWQQYFVQYRHWALSQVGVLLLFLPWFPVAREQFPALHQPRPR